MINDLDLLQSQLSPNLNGGWQGQNQQANQGLAALAMLQRIRGNQPQAISTSLPQNPSVDTRPSFVGIDEYGRGESYGDQGLIHRDPGYSTGLSPAQIAAMMAQSQQAKGTPAASYGNVPDVNVATLQNQNNPQVQSLASQLQFAVNPDLQKRLNASLTSWMDKEGNLQQGFDAGINMKELPPVNPDDLFNHPAFQGLQNQHPEVANQVYQKLVPGGDLKEDLGDFHKRRVAQRNSAGDYVNRMFETGQAWQDKEGNIKLMREVPASAGSLSPTQKEVVDIQDDPTFALAFAKARQTGNINIPIIPTPDEKFRQQNKSIPPALVPEVRAFLKDHPEINPKVGYAAYLQAKQPMATRQQPQKTMLNVLDTLQEQKPWLGSIGKAFDPSDYF